MSSGVWCRLYVSPTGKTVGSWRLAAVPSVGELVYDQASIEWYRVIERHFVLRGTALLMVEHVASRSGVRAIWEGWPVCRTEHEENPRFVQALEGMGKEKQNA